MSTRKSNLHRKHQKKRKKTRKNKAFNPLKCSPQRKGKLNSFTCYNTEALFKIRNSWSIKWQIVCPTTICIS